MNRWITEEARIIQIYSRNIRELWRSLLDDIRADVKEWGRIYSQRGITELEYGDCDPMKSDLVRVRAVPSGMNIDSERFITVVLNTDAKTISSQLSTPEDRRRKDDSGNAVALPEDTLHIFVDSEAQKIYLAPMDDSQNRMSCGTASQRFLRPLLKGFGDRIPVINLLN